VSRMIAAMTSGAGDDAGQAYAGRCPSTIVTHILPDADDGERFVLRRSIGAADGLAQRVSSEVLAGKGPVDDADWMTALNLPKGSCNPWEIRDAGCDVSSVPVWRTSAVTMIAMTSPRAAAKDERTRLSTRNWRMRRRREAPSAPRRAVSWRWKRRGR
jgi:hypothetical protein